ncbi:MAG: IPTL-CTERM sorting domain-containing protein [Thermoanaerobaculia bacterium]
MSRFPLFGGPDPMARSRICTFAFAAFWTIATSASADVSGLVRVEGSGEPGTPIAGAYVHIQADLTTPGTFSAADGSFTLTGIPPGLVFLAASIPYLRSAPQNFIIGGATAADGDTGIDIRMEEMSTTNDPSYVPPDVSECGACHFERYKQWTTSHHAYTAQNKWVLDLFSGTGTPGGSAGYVFKNSHDPGETGFCATCHAPMQDLQDPRPEGVPLDEATEPNGAQGVICVTCHQMDSIDESHINALHHRGKATYRFPVPSKGASTASYVWGPMNDVTFSLMRPSYSLLHTKSQICASCHQYHNPTTDAPGQNTFLEWQSSPYGTPGPNYKVCQDCHMPNLAGEGENCEFGAPTRQSAQRHAHTFIGSTPQTLSANIALTSSAAQLPSGNVKVTSSIDNFGAGHDFPTGISIRNAMLWITATLNGQPLAQVSGPKIPFWGSDDVPGDQPGDLAGQPGKGFAKVLQGRINGQGPVVMPVLFIDAESVFSLTTIPSGTIDTTEVEFAVPPGTPAGSNVEVTAVLLYRRAWRALAVTKGWTVTTHGDPIEVEVARNEATIVVEGTGGVIEIPALSPTGLATAAALLAAAGWFVLRRRRAAR